jgi:hypothetical protein
MGADKLAENTPNVLIFICPSPKVWDVDEKRFLWASVVRVATDKNYYCGNGLISFSHNFLLHNSAP